MFVDDDSDSGYNQFIYDTDRIRPATYQSEDSFSEYHNKDIYSTRVLRIVNYGDDKGSLADWALQLTYNEYSMRDECLQHSRRQRFDHVFVLAAYCAVVICAP